MNYSEINNKYLKKHSELGTLKAAGNKEEHKAAHSTIWNNYIIELKARRNLLRLKVVRTEPEQAELLQLELRSDIEND
tara:strand:- start:823 stop:1056 length:234 start_codon:yes stop_codon:yes gene_type:complete